MALTQNQNMHTIMISLPDGRRTPAAAWALRAARAAAPRGALCCGDAVARYEATAAGDYPGMRG